jgi:hypothetical protein
VTEQNDESDQGIGGVGIFPMPAAKSAKTNGVPRPRSKIASTDFERHVAAGRQDQCKRELRRRNWCIALAARDRNPEFGAVSRT